MTETEIILELMKKQKLNEPTLAKMIGYGSNASIWKRLHKSKSMKVADFLKILDALGMEVVIRPQGKYRTKYKLTTRNSIQALYEGNEHGHD